MCTHNAAQRGRDDRNELLLFKQSHRPKAESVCWLTDVKKPKFGCGRHLGGVNKI